MSKLRINLNEKLYDLNEKQINEAVCPICGSPVKTEQAKPLTLKSILTTTLIVQMKEDEKRPIAVTKMVEDMIFNIHYAAKSIKLISFNSDERKYLSDRVRQYSAPLISGQVSAILEGRDNPLSPSTVKEKAQNMEDEHEAEKELERHKLKAKEKREAKNKAGADKDSKN